MSKFTIGNLNIKNGSLITGDNHRISIQQQSDGQPIVIVDAEQEAIEERPGQYFCGICGWADIETFPHNH